MLNLNPRFGNNFLDANVLDPSSPAEDAIVDRILALAREHAFTLLLPYSVQAEINHPNTPPEVKSKAAPLLYSIRVNLTAPELATHARLRALIQGNAQPGKHAADAFHLVESAKNGGRFFITRDDRLLQKAPDVLRELLMAVVTPREFLDAYLAGQKQ